MRDLKVSGQSTVSRLLKLLGAIKIQAYEGTKDLFRKSPAASFAGCRTFNSRKWSSALNIIAEFYPYPYYGGRLWSRRRENSGYTHCRAEILGVVAGIAVLSGSHHGLVQRVRRWYTNKLIICLRVNLNFQSRFAMSKSCNGSDPKTELSIIADNLPGGSMVQCCTTFCLYRV